MREEAARLCEVQAEIYAWNATRFYALSSDAETAAMLRRLAAAIRAIPEADG